MRVVQPDGTVWEVDTSRLPWRPRRVRLGGFDFIGALLTTISFPLLAVEWLAAGALGAVRPRKVVVATSNGPPARRLLWHMDSRAATTAKGAEVAQRLSAGEDLAPDADEREVGA